MMSLCPVGQLVKLEPNLIRFHVQQQLRKEFFFKEFMRGLSKAFSKSNMNISTFPLSVQNFSLNMYNHSQLGFTIMSFTKSILPVW